MKKTTTIIILAMIASMALSACGKPLGSNEPVESTEISTEMQAFMDAFNGKASGTQKALEDYAPNASYDSEISDYNLENPIVTNVKGDCYTMEAEYSTYIREYDVCWESGEITEIRFNEELDRDTL